MYPTKDFIRRRENSLAYKLVPCKEKADRGGLVPITRSATRVCAIRVRIFPVADRWKIFNDSRMRRLCIICIISYAFSLHVYGCALDDEDDFDELTAEDDGMLVRGDENGRRYDCPGGYSNCNCHGSLYNCELPNPQPDRNRYGHPENPREKAWSILPGASIKDGLGNQQSVIPDFRDSIMVNYGQRKNLNAEPHVYAFAVNFDPSDDLSRYDGRSGWVAESIFSGALNMMPTVNPRNPGGPYTKYVIRSGIPNWLANYGGELDDLKVVPNFTGLNRAAADYFEHNGLVNILFNLPTLGGVSTDSFPPGVVFERARNVGSLYVPMYDKGSGTPIDKKLIFYYGRVNGRFGWIARDALRKPKKPKKSKP
jgi:hypothetical protein